MIVKHMDRLDNFRFIVEMRQIIILVLPVLLLLQTATASTLYKWVDDNGNIVYSQTMPPPGAKVLQQPRIRGLHTPATPAESETPPSQAQTATGAPTSSPEAQPARDLSEEQQEQYRDYCNNLRKNLELLKQPKRVYVSTEDGGRHYLGDEEREEKIGTTNEKISEHCQDK
jgi:hypothetical protein